MHPSYSMDHVTRAADASLGVQVRQVRKRVPVPELGLLVAGQAPRTRYTTEVVEERTEQWSKLVGVLACPPNSPVGKSEVLPNLDYFHHRSSHFVDMFCIGYLPSSTARNEDAPVVTVGGRNWNFEATAFEGCRRELERETNWKYSGETDLVLAIARKEPDRHAWIDYSCAISCNLEQMLRDKAITSVRSFFEHVFRAGEKYEGSDPVWRLSDALGLRVGGNLLVECILSLLPERVGASYKAAQHFAVRDVSR